MWLNNFIYKTILFNRIQPFLVGAYKFKIKDFFNNLWGHTILAWKYKK